MKSITVFFLLSLGVALALAAMWIRTVIDMIRKTPEIEAENATLKGENRIQEMLIYQAQVREELLNRFKAEYISGWRAEGYAAGLDRLLDKMAELKAESADAEMNRARLREKDIEARLQYESREQLQRANKMLTDNREEFHAKLLEEQEKNRKLRDSIRLLEARQFPEMGMTLSYSRRKDSQEDSQKSTPEYPHNYPAESPEYSRNNSAESPEYSHQNPEGTPAQGKLREYDPRIFELEGNRWYDLRDETIPGKGYTGRIHLVDRASNQVTATFSSLDLTKGLAHLVEGTAIIVIWCALPSCDVLKITQLISTRCCCEDHAAKHRRYLANKSKTAG